MEEYLEKQRENLAAVGIVDKEPETLADRMKLYEGVYAQRLDPDLPIIIRVDGKNFSKYTKQFSKPFDMLLVHAMIHCAEKLAKELQGFQMAYHQSDEISFLVNKSPTSNSEVCFGGKVNKINSLCASYMAGYFNRFMGDYSEISKLAFFDCRCFNVPMADVPNYFLHRAKDWRRNSITMLGRQHFSQKEMHGQNSAKVKFMLATQKDVHWGRLVDELKYGTFITKTLGFYVDNDEEIVKSGFKHTHLEAKYEEVEKLVKDAIGVQG